MTDLLPGDLVLVAGPAGLAGWIIQFGQHVRFYGWRKAIRWAAPFLVGRARYDLSDAATVHHVAVHVGDGKVIEALAKGLQLSQLSKYPPASYRVARLSRANSLATVEQRRALTAFAYEQLGRHFSYGWLSILTDALQIVTPEKLDISWDGAVTCSGFGGQCWEHAGVSLPFRAAITSLPGQYAAWADAPDA